jgi:Sec-independent protein translocase protein TatA
MAGSIPLPQLVLIFVIALIIFGPVGFQRGR